MNENNNFNANFNDVNAQPVQPGMGMNPGQPMQSGMGMNPGQPMQSGMGMNPGQPVQPGMGMNPGQPMQQGMGMNPGQPMQLKKNKNKKGLIIALSSLFVVVTIIIVVLLLSGTKTLKCTLEENEDGIVYSTTFVFKFKDDTVNKFEFKINANYGSNKEKKEEEFYEIEEMFNQFRDEYGMNVNITSDDSHITAKATGDKKVIEQSNFLGSSTYEDLKTEYESDGFICK